MWVFFGRVRKRKEPVGREKGVPARVADARLITPYTSYLLRGLPSTTFILGIMTPRL